MTFLYIVHQSQIFSPKTPPLAPLKDCLTLVCRHLVDTALRMSFAIPGTRPNYNALDPFVSMTTWLCKKSSASQNELLNSATSAICELLLYNLGSLFCAVTWHRVQLFGTQEPPYSNAMASSLSKCLSTILAGKPKCLVQCFQEEATPIITQVTIYNSV